MSQPDYSSSYVEGRYYIETTFVDKHMTPASMDITNLVMALTTFKGI